MIGWGWARDASGGGMSEREALVEWLGRFPFTHWTTWTFGQKWPDGPSPASVARHTRRFCEAHPDIGPWFFVVERGTSGQFRCHSHGLIGPPPGPLPLRAQMVWRRWAERYGRNTVEPLRDETRDLRWYVTKYITKEAERRLGDLAWDIGV